MSQRAAHIEILELQLKELNKKMLRLEATEQDTTEDARQKYRDEMRKLRQQSKVAVAKLDDLKAARAESWENLVFGMEQMNDAFKQSFYSIFHGPDARESSKACNSSSRTMA